MAHAQNTGVPKKRRIFLRVWESNEYDPEDDGRTYYHAKIGRTFEIEGWVYYGDSGGVKEALRRILKAEAPLPDKMAKAVDSAVNHLVTALELGSTVAAASAGFDYSEREGLVFTVELFYGDDGRWAVEVRAVNTRHNGTHRLSKRAALNQVTAEALRKIIEKAVRQAYNSSP
jgi:hypothetical protein